VYGGKALHFFAAALLSLTSTGLGFVWLCCRLDEWHSGNPRLAPSPHHRR
jgi:hypothetical protein